MYRNLSRVLAGVLSWRMAIGALIVAAVGLPALLAVRTYRIEQGIFFPEARAPAQTPADTGISRLRSEEIAAGGETLSAWYAPSQNGSAIILCHGAGGNRSQLVGEAKALHEQGFGALLFDWPGHGESSGAPTWNQSAVNALSHVVDWLSTQPDVTGPLGAFGFSMGGYVLALKSPGEPRLASVVLSGTPSDINEQVRLSYPRLALIKVPAARYALTRHGMALDAPQPADIIAKLAPRPLLVIGGSADGTVPPSLVQALFDKAGSPKQLHMIEGASHGDYLERGKQAYLSRVVGHFRTSLGR